jgi:hypothetical protein
MHKKGNIANNTRNDSCFYLHFPRIELFKKLSIYSMAAAGTILVTLGSSTAKPHLDLACVTVYTRLIMMKKVK